ncbi:MAG TPA: hypothetical protein VF511_00500 [Chthoniobacterales bacterium]
MKLIASTLLVTLGMTTAAFAQKASPTASSSPATAAGATANTDLYHVHFAKSAPGKAAEHADMLKTPDPKAPMPGHLVVFRHLNGDAWDYCVIEHLGTKATVEASRPLPPASQIALGDWHTDTFVSGPSWTEFAKQMGLDDASKGTASGYVVSIYRPVPGQREGLEKFLSEPPDRAVDTSSGNIVLQHMEGDAWSFLAIARYNSWADYGKNETNSVAQMNKKEGGWFKLRSLVSFHTDTLCDRIAP